MPAVFRTVTTQVADHIRTALMQGRWSGILPGRSQLAGELGVNGKTVEAAVRQLESEGILINQGAGRRRRIELPAKAAAPSLRVAILLNEGIADQKSQIYIELVHGLGLAGHTVVLAAKSLSEIRFDLKALASLVRQTRADAWIVTAGSREVLEWFAAQPIAAFALFGHRSGLKIPAVGPDKLPAVCDAARHLIAHGHRRIVLLCRKIRRLPQPGLSETAFLETLRAHDCKVGDYNLPDWDETNEGFQRCLGALFRVTPPTALIVDEATYFVAAIQFLLSRGLRVPAEVSLICTDDDPAFAHCHPSIAHIRWDFRPVVRRVLQWAGHISRGKADVRQSFSPATFVPGGTIGPAPPPA